MSLPLLNSFTLCFIVLFTCEKHSFHVCYINIMMSLLPCIFLLCVTQSGGGWKQCHGEEKNNKIFTKKIHIYEQERWKNFHTWFIHEQKADISFPCDDNEFIRSKRHIDWYWRTHIFFCFSFLRFQFPFWREIVKKIWKDIHLKNHGQADMKVMKNENIDISVASNCENYLLVRRKLWKFVLKTWKRVSSNGWVLLVQKELPAHREALIFLQSF